MSLPELVFESSFERDYTILEKSFDIEFDKIINNYTAESALLTLEEDETFLEAAGNKFSDAVHKIIDTIVNFINSFIEMIENAFSNKKHITGDDFINSKTGQLTFNADAKKIQAQIDDEVLKGRKIIQAISSKTGIDDKTVADFCDKALDVGKNVGKFALPVAAAWGVKTFLLNSMKKDKEQVKQLGDEVAKETDPKKQKQKMKVLQKLKKDLSIGTKYGADFAKTLLDEYTKTM